MRYLWHATSEENLSSILENGLRPGDDGQVYLCEQPKEAIRFVLFRNLKAIATIKIAVSEEDEPNIKESFDHSIEFFQCRAYGHWGPISKEKIAGYEVYERRKPT